MNDDRNSGYEAAKRASDHADRVHCVPLWSKLVWVRFLEYLVRVGPGAEFTTEQFRGYAKTHSCPEPPDARAFGNITRKAAKQKLIEDSHKRAREGSHGREVVVWCVR